MDIEATSQVVERIPIPSTIFESELPASALSPITADDMPAIQVDWDGEPVELEPAETETEEIDSSFSSVSILLLCLIIVICLTVAYINRKLLMAKFRKNCMRANKQTKQSVHIDDSMVGASKSIMKMQESIGVNHEEIFL